MIELSEQQRQELSHPEPMAIDPATQQTYVLVRQDVYQQMKWLVEGRLDMRAAYPLMDAVAANAGWNDPAMDIYDDFARDR